MAPKHEISEADIIEASAEAIKRAYLEAGHSSEHAFANDGFLSYTNRVFIANAVISANPHLIAAPYMLRALELSVPVLREVVANGLLGVDEWSDRLALDAAESAIATAKPQKAA
jgi:hypothetical protein